MTTSITTKSLHKAVHPGAGVPWHSKCVSPQKYPLPSAAYVDEPLLMVTGTGQNTAKYYFHSNHLYSVAALTNASGQVVERFKYDAYGKRTVLEADGSTVKAKSSFGQTRGFTGYQLDEETGLYYARSRMYSSGLGRFIGRDIGVRLIIGSKPRIYSQTFSEINVEKTAQTFPYSPYAGRGYHDGMNLYQAYYIPNTLDPSGLLSFKFETRCGTITATLTPDTTSSNVASFKAVFTPNDKCCCVRYPAAQWISENNRGWTSDNPDNPHGSWYSYNPDSDTYTNPAGLGGDGVVQDGPDRRARFGYATWLTCFYCKTKDGHYDWLGCVMWYHYTDPDLTGNWGIGGIGPHGPPAGGAAAPINQPNTSF